MDPAKRQRLLDLLVQLSSSTRSRSSSPDRVACSHSPTPAVEVIETKRHLPAPSTSALIDLTEDDDESRPSGSTRDQDILDLTHDSQDSRQDDLIEVESPRKKPRLDSPAPVLIDITASTRTTTTTTTVVTTSTAVEGDAHAARDQEVENEARSTRLDCPICLDKMKAMATAKCGHVFCDPCIREVVVKTQRCPLCQKPLKLKEIITLYL